MKKTYLVTVGVKANAYPGLDLKSFYLDDIDDEDLTYDEVIEEAEKRGLNVERLVALSDVPRWFRESDPPAGPVADSLIKLDK